MMHNTSPWLTQLNEPQYQAVTAPLGNTLVLAGAGSGKTRVLVSRIAWLIEAMGLQPRSILAVTFTNKAAGEMQQRLRDLLAGVLDDLWVGTFHGLCHRLLRRHYQEANLTEQFHILDHEDQARMIKRVMTSLNLNMEQWPVKQAQSFINSHKEEGCRAKNVHVLAYGPGKTLLRIYQAYEQACHTAGVIDFPELILRAYELLRDHPSLLMHYQQRFQAILVDEFQDTNSIQYAWIKLLSSPKSSVMVVGDDDQSIYGWRGAKIENIQRFSDDFPHVQLIRLEQNYRSTSTILSAANALINHNAQRVGKNLWTDGHRGEPILLFQAFNELEEARFVSECILKELREGRNRDEIAILYRSNAQSRVLEEALLHAGIAYRIHGGVRFFERAEIKDALAYLRLIVNPHDDAALERVINFPTRGIGEKTVSDLQAYAREHQSSIWQAATEILQSNVLPTRAASALTNFIQLITDLQQQTENAVLEEQMNAILQHSGLYAHYGKSKTDRFESKLENLNELMNATKQFRYEYFGQLSPTTAFLAHVALEAGEMQTQTDERCVHMMTLHAAKGLEFPVVFLVGMEEGVFPSNQDPERIEEERRLCYVGMTRAMQKLIFSHAEVRRQYGREEYHRPSRFLKELPAELIEEVRPKATFQRPVKYAHSSTGLAEKHDSGLQVGQQVTHAKFGQGVILSIDGNGVRTRIQVKFRNEVESKWLMLAYANLQL